MSAAETGCRDLQRLAETGCRDLQRLAETCRDWLQRLAETCRDLQRLAAETGCRDWRGCRDWLQRLERLQRLALGMVNKLNLSFVFANVLPPVTFFCFMSATFVFALVERISILVLLA